MLKKVGRILLLLLFTGAFWFLTQQQPAYPAPDAEFATLNGERVALKNLRGRAVLVTFWATNCPSCLKEIPHLMDLYRTYHAQGLEVIAVAMPYDPPNHVVDMVQAQHLPYTIALDLYGDTVQAFGNVMFTPTTFLIDPSGNIVWQIIGQFNVQDMNARLSPLLRSKNG